MPNNFLEHSLTLTIFLFGILRNLHLADRKQFYETVSEKLSFQYRLFVHLELAARSNSIQSAT